MKLPNLVGTNINEHFNIFYTCHDVGYAKHCWPTTMN